MIEDMEKRMREHAANLEFEEAARLRDEVKRLREVELAVADDPMARQEDVEERAGKLPRARSSGGKPGTHGRMARPHKPSLDEMGPHSERVVPKGKQFSRGSSPTRKS